MKPKKRYGQNFLINDNISKTIALKSDIGSKVVFEIGPGKGALTKHLIKDAAAVYAFEIDGSFKQVLNKLEAEHQNLKVIYGDVLRQDFNKIIEQYSLNDVICVANIPYNITGPLLTKLKDTEKISRLTLMVQKEVANRLLAKTGSKAYGTLTVIYQFYYKIEKVIDVKRNNFYPVPKVDSMVVRMDKHDTYLKQVKDIENFIKFVNASFTQKRKTLVNNLKANFRLTTEEVTTKLKDIQPNFNVLDRAENISVEQFIKFSNGWFT